MGEFLNAIVDHETCATKFHLLCNMFVASHIFPLHNGNMLIGPLWFIKNGLPCNRFSNKAEKKNASLFPSFMTESSARSPVASILRHNNDSRKVILLLISSDH